jgi:YVTN family beta-propeller protein
MGRHCIAAAVFALCAFASVGIADQWREDGDARAGSMPWSVTVSADGDTLWVSMVGLRNRDNVWRYDADTLEVKAKASYRGHAVESVLIDGGARLVVTNSRDDKRMVLDAETLEVERAIEVGRIPKDFRLTADEKTAYIANWGGGSLSVVDLEAGKLTHDIRVGRNARGVALSPDGGEAYVMAFGPDEVIVVDTATRKVEARIDACKNPRHAQVVGDHLLVTCFGARHVAVIDRNERKVVRKLRVGRGPKTIAVSPDQTIAVTADEKSNTLSFIDLESWTVNTVKTTGRKPCGVQFAPDGSRLYVTARGSHELIVLERRAD